MLVFTAEAFNLSLSSASSVSFQFSNRDTNDILKTITDGHCSSIHYHISRSFNNNNNNNNDNNNLRIFNRITYQYLQILLSLGSCLPTIYNNKRKEQCPF